MTENCHHYYIIKCHWFKLPIKPYYQNLESGANYHKKTNFKSCNKRAI